LRQHFERRSRRFFTTAKPTWKCVETRTAADDMWAVLRFLANY